VHRGAVARIILRDYHPPAGSVPTEHVPTHKQAAQQRLGALLESATT
jgi:acyl-CoA dehydrogenase